MICGEYVWAAARCDMELFQPPNGFANSARPLDDLQNEKRDSCLVFPVGANHRRPNLDIADDVLQLDAA